MTHTQTQYLSTMMIASANMHVTNWNAISSHVENELRCLLLMLSWLEEMRLKHEMTTEQARIHIDIQKTTMRTRLMALPNVNMLEAEHIINAAIDSIRKDLYAKMDWVII